MSPLMDLSLVLRREWLTRRSWLLVVGLILLVPLVLGAEQRTAWVLFSWLCLLPLLAVGLASTHDVEADRYWAALSGAPVLRGLARLTAHGAILALVGGLLVPYLWPSFAPVGAPSAPGAGLLLGAFTVAVVLSWGVIYVSAALARRATSAGGALAGPLLAAALLALGAGADHAIGAWSVLEGLVLRLDLLAAAGAVALVHLEGRLGRPREPVALLGGAVLLVGAVSLLHLATGARPLLLTPTLQAVAADGQAALYVPQSAGPFASRRALLWRNEHGFTPVGPAGASGARLLEDGRVLMIVPGEGGQLWVGGPEGGTSCPLPSANAGINGVTQAGEAVLAILYSASARAAVVLHPDGRCELGEGAAGSLGPFTWKQHDDGRLDLSPPGLPAPSSDRLGIVEAGVLREWNGDGSWPIPGDIAAGAAELVPEGDGVRAFFDEGPILTFGPEGLRDREALTLWEALRR